MNSQLHVSFYVDVNFAQKNFNFRNQDLCRALTYQHDNRSFNTRIPAELSLTNKTIAPLTPGSMQNSHLQTRQLLLEHQDPCRTLTYKQQDNCSFNTRIPAEPSLTNTTVAPLTPGSLQNSHLPTQLLPEHQDPCRTPTYQHDNYSFNTRIPAEFSLINTRIPAELPLTNNKTIAPLTPESLQNSHLPTRQLLL